MRDAAHFKDQRAPLISRMVLAGNPTQRHNPLGGVVGEPDKIEIVVKIEGVRPTLNINVVELAGGAKEQQVTSNENKLSHR